MDINLTLLGEFITFGLFVFITMKFIWPRLMQTMEERQKRIADGLEAAERGHKSLELAQQQVTKQLKESKKSADIMIADAKKQMAKIIEEAKGKAEAEGKRMLTLAQSDIAHETEAAREKLRAEVAALVIKTTEKILQQNIDKTIDQKLVDKAISELENGGR